MKTMTTNVMKKFLKKLPKDIENIIKDDIKDIFLFLFSKKCIDCNELYNTTKVLLSQEIKINKKTFWLGYVNGIDNKCCDRNVCDKCLEDDHSRKCDWCGKSVCHDCKGFKICEYCSNICPDCINSGIWIGRSIVGCDVCRFPVNHDW